MCADFSEPSNCYFSNVRADPSRNDARAAESAQRLLHRLRVSVLQAYNRQLGRFEEGMRAQRERRNENAWNFCDYFLIQVSDQQRTRQICALMFLKKKKGKKILLSVRSVPPFLHFQEELAFVYEMLGVYDESLVQYDELDALFTQFVLNSNLSGSKVRYYLELANVFFSPNDLFLESPSWLNSFTFDFNNWSGVSLRPNGQINRLLRAKIIDKKPSLIDVRNYLFSRQSLMLLKLGRPWEVSQVLLFFPQMF